MVGVNWAAQPLWYIDEILGDDCNRGDTPLVPIKTADVIRQRVGDSPLTTAVGINIVGNLGGAFANPLRLWFNLNSGAKLSVTGQQTTILYPPGGGVSTFTGVTNINRAANQAQEVADASVPVSLTASGFVNSPTSTYRRLRITSGARAGAVSLIAKDLGAKNGRAQPFVLPGTTTVVSPQIGDPYVLESLSLINDFSADCRTGTIIPNAGVGPAAIPVNFADFALANTPGNRPTARSLVISPLAPTYNFFGCDTGRLVFNGGQGIAGLSACKMSGIDIVASGNLLTLFSCASLGSVVVRAGASVSADFDNLFQGGGVLVEVGGTCLCGTAAVFDKAAGAIPDGVTVRAGGTLLCRTNLDATHLMYGSGNAGVGLNVQAGAKGSYQANKPVITGALGDSQIGGVIYSWANVPMTSNQSHIIQAGIKGALAGAGTKFANPDYTESATGVVGFVCTQDGTVLNLRGKYRLTPGTTDTWTVQVNGVDTTITAACVNPALAFSDTTHRVSVLAGDLVTFKVAEGNAGGADASASLEFRPSASNSAGIFVQA